MDDEKSRVGPAGIALLVLVAAVVAALVFRRPDADDGSTLERIRERGVARVGFANEAPYGYRVPETGEVTGEAPEIARLVLQRMGVEKMTPVVTEFGSLIPGLKAGRFDLVAAGMYITPERCRQIDFSNPTYSVGESFLVEKGNPLDLHGFQDIVENEAVRLGVVGGTVEQGYAQKLGVPDDRLVIFPDNASALSGLLADRIDVFAITYLTAGDLLRKARTDAIERAEPFEDPVIDGVPVRGYGAFGFREEDDALRREFNRQLARFIGTEEHLELVRPFGFGESTLPGDVTAEELCEPD